MKGQFTSPGAIAIAFVGDGPVVELRKELRLDGVEFVVGQRFSNGNSIERRYRKLEDATAEFKSWGSWDAPCGR